MMKQPVLDEINILIESMRRDTMDLNNLFADNEKDIDPLSHLALYFVMSRIAKDINILRSGALVKFGDFDESLQMLPDFDAVATDYPSREAL